MYTPRPFSGDSLEDLRQYLLAELDTISLVSRVGELEYLRLKEHHAAPPKPREGLIAFADGTDWNPGGTGRGIYVYSSSAWVKL